jgi:hypothetical protein
LQGDSKTNFHVYALRTGTVRGPDMSAAAATQLDNRSGVFMLRVRLCRS